MSAQGRSFGGSGRPEPQAGNREQGGTRWPSEAEAMPEATNRSAPQTGAPRGGASHPALQTGTGERAAQTGAAGRAPQTWAVERASGGVVRGAVAFEWAKLWSVRATWWCFGVAAFLQLAYAVLVGLDARLDLEDSGGSHPLVVSDAGLLSIQFAQYALIACALLAMTSEYSTGTISLTLRAVPVRGRMLAAKAVVVGGAMAAFGVVLHVVGSVAAGIAAGSAARWEIGDLLTDALLAGVYAGVLAVFTLGIGAALRSAVGGLTVVLVIAVVLPAVLARISLGFVETINDYLPGSAGVAVMYGAVSNVATPQPYGPLTGVLVLALWAAAMLTAGWAVLRRRDA